jgi:outer membrane lipoprotein-sorting protein
MISAASRFSVLVSAVVLVAGAHAAEPAIIAKARAFVGSEAALEAVRSVHYVGTLVTTDPADPAKQTRAAMEIIFQKPEQQRIMATSDKTIEVTALDGYEGWQRIQDAADPSKWRQTLLGTEQIKRLRANTWENLSFFRGIERLGGRVEEQGTKEIDGVMCQKIAFIHAPAIVFYRYFDIATGRLVFTETEAGGTIREQGEMIVDGVRFPRSIVTATKNAKGELQTVTINFEKIVLNQTFPAQQFRVPALSVR